MCKNTETSVLRGLTPRTVFAYFDAISRIPRGSGNEKQVSDYVVNLAKQQGYEVMQDEAWNVIVNIPATKGYEEKKVTILQAHLDMVCVKDIDSSHDFTKDALALYIDGKDIRARGTSLGADNGIGAAMLLAIMDDNTICHPPLQLVFTTGEEVLFTGALALDANLLQGEQMIGLDCSDSHAIVASCAGISIHKMEISCGRESMLNLDGMKFKKIRVEDLCGGHSGNMIHLGRASAIKVIGNLLTALAEPCSYALISLECPGAINTISKEAEAIIAYEPNTEETILSVLEGLCTQACEAYRRTEPNMKIKTEVLPASQLPLHNMTKLRKEAAEKLLCLLDLLPFGVNTLIDGAGSMAESSVNLGSLHMQDEKALIEISIRSNSEYQHDNLARKLRLIAEVTGADYQQVNRTACWEYKYHSMLRERAENIYLRCNGSAPVIKKLHASVEAGVFVKKRRETGCDLDVINIGVDIKEPHTTREAVDIQSVEKTWDFLLQLLKEVE